MWKAIVLKRDGLTLAMACREEENVYRGVVWVVGRTDSERSAIKLANECMLAGVKEEQYEV